MIGCLPVLLANCRESVGHFPFPSTQFAFASVFGVLCASNCGTAELHDRMLKRHRPLSGDAAHWRWPHFAAGAAAASEAPKLLSGMDTHYFVILRHLCMQICCTHAVLPGLSTLHPSTTHAWRLGNLTYYFCSRGGAAAAAATAHFCPQTRAQGGRKWASERGRGGEEEGLSGKGLRM